MRVMWKSYDLRKHRKYHIGKRKFECTICHKGFYHACDVKIHVDTYR